MIIKGKSRGNGAQLGQYLVSPGENERVQVVEISGLSASDVPGALIEMDALSLGARTEKGLYHAQINTPANERLTEAQRARAVDELEKALGLTGQPRVVVIHEKKGREHIHVVWSRIDLEHMRAIPDSHNFAKHEAVARALEREFGHSRVQGAHAERDGTPRPKRTPSRAEMEQEKRTGLSTQQVTEEITALWRSTDSGKAFAAALTEAGYVLARGDRRDFVIVDLKGGTHSLARRIEGVRVKDVRERMADLDPRELPGVAEAKAIQRERRGREAERGAGVVRDGAREPGQAPQADHGRTHGTHERPGAGANAVQGVARSAGAILDGIASIFERGLSGDGLSQSDQERLANETAPPEPQVEPSVLADEEQRATRRQELLREFGRELEDERDAPFERERRRSR